MSSSETTWPAKASSRAQPTDSVANELPLHPLARQHALGEDVRVRVDQRAQAQWLGVVLLAFADHALHGHGQTMASRTSALSSKRKSPFRSWKLLGRLLMITVVRKPSTSSAGISLPRSDHEHTRRHTVDELP